ncbi:MAG: peptidylprolyl isomerase [Candidatus Diapherotrites archaeon]
MEKNDILLVELTGKTEDGKLIETTDKKTAEENSLDVQQLIFKPRIIILGKDPLLQGIEKALFEMNEGQAKELEIFPENAFGERKSELIRIIPLKIFKENKMAPFPGMVLEADGMHGKVQTVSGGRIRVDFNNELAGKKVFYKIKVIKKLSSDKEKALALSEKYFPIENIKAEFEKETLTVSLPKEMPKEMN